MSYYLPDRAIQITVTQPPTPDGKAKPHGTAVVAVTNAYGDINEHYKINFNAPVFTHNKSVIEVTTAGLLKSAKNEVTTKLSEATTALTKSIAHTTLDTNNTTLNNTCLAGKHVFVFTYDEIKENKGQACEFAISIKQLGEPIDTSFNTTDDADSVYNGIFYRLNEPYVVNLTSPHNNYSSLVLLPNNSNTQFIAYKRAFFANNNTNLTFSDGVLTKVDTDHGAELVGLLEFPASILSSYMTAVGELFTNFNSNATSEVKYYESLLNIEKAKLKHEKCMTAVQAEPQDEQTIKDESC